MNQQHGELEAERLALEVNQRYLRSLERLKEMTANGRQNPAWTRRLRRLGQERRPRVLKPDRRAWVWSDLHLHHRNIIRYTKRPFATVEEMDRALYEAWWKRIGANDDLICGGDIAMSGTLTGTRREKVAEAPGRKLLILGNHDIRKDGRVSRTGFAETCVVAVTRTEPALVLTHAPLDEVPENTVNVHGHVHNNEALRDGPYINICVEHLDYEPVELASVLDLARALLDGHLPRSGTTKERLDGIAGTTTRQP